MLRSSLLAVLDAQQQACDQELSLQQHQAGMGVIHCLHRMLCMGCSAGTGPGQHGWEHDHCAEGSAIMPSQQQK